MSNTIPPAISSSAATTDPLLLGTLSGNSTSQATPKTPESKTEEAARQFESLLITQMLQSARESTSLGLGDDDGDQQDRSQSSTMFDIADQQFAQMLSRQGGFGLARMAAIGLNKSS